MGPRLLYHDEYLTLVGSKHPAALGRTMGEVWPELVDAVQHPLDTVRDQGPQLLVNRELALGEGGERRSRWFTATWTPIHDDTGAVIGVFNVSTETTDRVLAERNLRESEERQAFLLKLSDRLRTLADPIRIMAVASETLGRHLGVGRCGYGETDPTGAFLIVERDWTDGRMPSAAGKHRFADFGEEIMATLLAGNNTVVDDTLPRVTEHGVAEACHAAGELRASIGIPLMKDGGMVAALFVQQSSPRRWLPTDVALAEETAERTWAALERARAEAALQDSEAKYRSLFDTMAEGFAVCGVVRDAEGRVIDLSYVELNEALARLTGLDREGVIGRRFTDVFPPADSQRWLPIYARVVESGEPATFELNAELLGRWYEVSVYPRGQEQISIVFREMTQRIKAEAVLRESEERQAFLLKLSDALRAEPDADAVANRAIRMLSEQMQLDRCYIATYRIEDDRADFTHQVGNERVPAPAGFGPLVRLPRRLRAGARQDLRDRRQLREAGPLGSRETQ